VVSLGLRNPRSGPSHAALSADKLKESRKQNEVVIIGDGEALGPNRNWIEYRCPELFLAVSGVQLVLAGILLWNKTLWTAALRMVFSDDDLRRESMQSARDAGAVYQGLISKKVGTNNERKRL
jgi:hypothetical protein